MSTHARFSAIFARYCVTLALAAAVLLAGGAHAQDRVADYYRLKNEGKWPEALQKLREEIADPKRTVDPDTHLSNVRQNLMVALGEYAGLHGGFDEKMDAEVRQLYEDGMSRSAKGDPGRVAILENGYAIYYSKTYRNGLGLPYMRRELQHWLKTGNVFRTVLGYHAISSAYADMGQATLARYYSAKSLEAAKPYYVLGSRPSDLNEWVQYWVVLGQFMTNAAMLGDRAEVERLWAVREPIPGRYWGLASSGYLEAAEQFGLMGERQRALELLQTGLSKWAEERPKFSANANVQRLSDMVAVCKEGSVRMYVGEFAAAIKLFEHCEQLARAIGQKDSDISYALRGAAYEGAGDLERASQAYQRSIEGVERTRGSYSLAERANFFRTVLRKGYWGQTRVLARLASASGDAGQFFRALHTSELIRARQLGELLDPDASRRVSPENLAQLQKRLRPEEVVLAYTVTERDIVVLAMTAAGTRAALVPYEPAQLRALVRSIAADLARHDSPLDRLNDRLSELGRLVLSPVAADLAGKQRITVLPDGVLNLVPFELLSMDAGGYRPLYRDYIVTTSPSLLFVEHAERARSGGKAGGLFAVADPRYAKGPRFETVPQEDLAIAARGSRYLSYFDPLPETRTEVQAIGGMFAGAKVELLVGERALKSEVKKADLGAFSFLHFATHGVIGNEIPGLQEPALVLGDEPGEDGFLTMSDVSRFKLNADLTVLSACNTGSGEFVEGEGVMGMSRAFLAAGSRSVVVSLWPVASKATERLMVAFYRHLRGGANAADALRSAKLEMIEQARKTNPAEAHPFFWAPFIMLGG